MYEMKSFYVVFTLFTGDVAKWMIILGEAYVI